MQSSQIQFEDGKVISKDWLDSHPEAAQALLEKHKASYPRCLCNPDRQLPLYIAQKSVFYLARMPGTGDQHASYCSFFGAPPSMSGLAVYRQSAIEEKGNDVVALKISEGLGVRAKSQEANGSGASSKKGEANSHRSRLSLLALLQYLWHTAEFNRWSPKMRGKRNYFVLYKYLMAAAEKLEVKNKHLSQYLYLPEPFKVEHKEAIAKRAQQKLYDLLLDSGGRKKRMLVVGVVKKFSASQYGYGVQLKHAPPPLTFWLNNDVLGSFLKEAGGAIEDPNALLGDDHHLVMIMTVDRTATGNYAAAKAACMKTNKDYIPFDNPHQQQMLDDLQQTRLFSRQLPFDAEKDDVFPDFLLLDAGRHPVPMYVFGYGQRPKHDAAVREHIKHFESVNEPCWYWDLQWDPKKHPAYPSPQYTERAFSPA